MSATPESLGTARSPLERARKNARILGKHIEQAGCVPTAEFAGIGKSTVSSWFSEHRDAMGKALAFMGLKVVPVDKQCFDPAEVEALRAMAMKYMARMKSADDLDWDEEHE